MATKIIILFVGPKGSGKSFAGTLVQEHFDIPFIRVEDWVKNIKRNRSVLDPDYIREVFTAIEHGIRESLQDHTILTFESTGISEDFDRMLSSLRQDFRVITIRLEAHPDICLQRVRDRDTMIHIPVSDAEVMAINQLVLEKNMPTDFVIRNEGISGQALIDAFDKILHRIK